MRPDPRLLVVSAAVLWGTTGTARALGPDDASPAAAGATRLIVGGACLLVVVSARSGRRATAAGGRRPRLAGHGGHRPRRRRHGRLPAALLRRRGTAGVAVGTVVGIGSAPVFAGVLGVVARGERLTAAGWSPRHWPWRAHALLVGAGDRDDVDPVGIALALGAGLAYATYVLASKLVLDRGWSPGAVTARVFGLAGLALVPVARWRPGWGGWRRRAG